MTGDVHVRYHHFDKLIVACNHSDESFVFICNQRRWLGEIGNCSAPKTTGNSLSTLITVGILRKPMTAIHYNGLIIYSLVLYRNQKAATVIDF